MRRIFVPRYRYLVAIVGVMAATAALLPGRAIFARENGLCYLLLIGGIAVICGVWPAIIAAVLAFFAWNFFFLPPYHTLRVATPQDWLALAVFLVVGIAMGVLAGRMRDREMLALARERETALLNRLSAHLVSLTSTAAMARVLLEEIIAIITLPGAALLAPGEDDVLQVLHAAPETAACDPRLPELAQWAYRYKCAIGLPAAPPHERWPISKAYAQVAEGVARPDLYLLLQGSAQVEGILYLGGRADVSFTPREVRLLLSIANLAAAFLERRRLEEAARRSETLVEADRMKSTLISSVSHELKTPLAAVTATVTSLLEEDVAWDVPMMREELQAVRADLERLHDNIGALLDFARLEADAWEPQRDWYEVGEVLGSVVANFPAAAQARIVFELPDDLPLLYVDFQQLARALQHLVENALAYSSAPSPVQIGANHAGRHLRLWVQDRGAGIPQEERARVFEKFYRGSAAELSPAGTGLGLAITAEIIRYHGGQIWVEDAPTRGSRFVMLLPLEGDPS